MRLQGRGIVITGANRGLGLAIAKACVIGGADVLICGRDNKALDSARLQLAETAVNGQQVIAFAADVSRAEEVEAMIGHAARQLPQLSGLVNNAGVYGPKGLTEEVDLAEWIRAVEINLLGTLLPCRQILPIFRKKKYGKIVNLSGGGATAPMPRFSAYAASKAAVVRLTETLAEETKDVGIDINAVAPGPLNTRLLDEVLDAGPSMVGRAFYDRALAQKEGGGVPLEKGASACAYLLSGESDGITGRLISAIWDPWEALQQRRHDLDKSDIYTLRRIVPKDRGLNWD